MIRNFTISVLELFLCLFITPAFAQIVSEKGKVTDAADNSALIGVTVNVKGTTNGTQTDVNGNYSISAPSNATLVFSYIGYTTQSIDLNGQTTINVPHTSSANQLQQVVVVGYGTQRKIDNTGAVASVKGSDISKHASVYAVCALQGKVSGVEIINNGAPGSSPTINF